jgi:hypothetical protein
VLVSIEMAHADETVGAPKVAGVLWR